MSWIARTHTHRVLLYGYTYSRQDIIRRVVTRRFLCVCMPKRFVPIPMCDGGQKKKSTDSVAIFEYLIRFYIFHRYVRRPSCDSWASSKWFHTGVDNTENWYLWAPVWMCCVFQVFRCKVIKQSPASQPAGSISSRLLIVFLGTFLTLWYEMLQVWDDRMDDGVPKLGHNHTKNRLYIL